MKQYNPLWYEIVFLSREDIVRTSGAFEGGDTPENSNDVDVGWRPGW